MPIDLNDHFNKKKAEGGGSGNGPRGPIEPPLKPPEFMKHLGKKAGILYAILIVLVLLFMTKPYVVINSGEVGILATAGKFEPIPLQPGIHFHIPIIQRIIVVDTKVRIINYRGQEDIGRNLSADRDGIISNDMITVLDSRGLQVGIELTVQYSIKPLSAPQTIATYGLAWEEKIVNPVVRDVVRGVVGQYKAEELPSERKAIANGIELGIRAKVESLDNQPVNIASIQLREIVLPTKIRDQIERVQIARQEAERARYEVERAVQEAEREAALAKGNADANRIRAQGQADKILIEAKSEAEANGLIAKSLTEPLLRLRSINVQGKFNEALQVNKDAKIFLTPGGAVPNIWLDAKDSQRTSSVESNKK